MFMILLKFTGRGGEASAHLDGHRRWVASGRADGVFLLVGSLASGKGGAILAHGASHAEIAARVALDPFVTEGIVEAEIHEFIPTLADERLAFLVPAA